MYAIQGEPNFLGPFSYGAHQIEPQFPVAHILTSRLVLYGVEVDRCDPQSIGGGWYTTVERAHPSCSTSSLQRYKCSLHAFQGGQRHHGRSGASRRLSGLVGDIAYSQF